MMPLWQRNLRILWAAQFIAMIGMSACLPFLPLYVRALGVSDLESAQRWSGIINSAPFVFSVIASPIWGALGDRYGRKLMVSRGNYRACNFNDYYGVCRQCMATFHSASFTGRNQRIHSRLSRFCLGHNTSGSFRICHRSSAKYGSCRRHSRRNVRRRTFRFNRHE